MPSAVKPEQVTKDLAHKLIAENDCFIFDCDGVLWKWSRVFADVPKLINCLIAKKKQIFFVTNNSTKSRKSYVDKLNGCGIKNIDKNNVISTSWLAAEYLKLLGFKDKVYVIAEDGVVDELKEAGIRSIGCGEDPYPANVDYGSLIVDIDPEVKCVVVGFDRHVSLLKVLKASTYIKRDGCIFIATNDDSNFPSDGKSIVYPGTGSILASVITATGVQPTILGKPHSPAFDLMNLLHNIEPSRSLMVGDKLETDIVFGNSHGLNTLAVLSGITNLEEISSIKNIDASSSLLPDYYVEDLDTFWSLLSDS